MGHDDDDLPDIVTNGCLRYIAMRPLTIGVAGSHGSPKFLAYLVILYLERRCRKQNTVARLKSKNLCPPKKFFGLATLLLLAANVGFVSPDAGGVVSGSIPQPEGPESESEPVSVKKYTERTRQKISRPISSAGQEASLAAVDHRASV